MFHSLKPIILAASFSLLALSSAADAAGIHEVEVNADLGAAQDANALARFPQIADDLKRAIAMRVPASDDPAAPRIKVNINKVSLDGDTVLPDAAEFNEIEGVLVYSGGSTSLVEPIRLTAYSSDRPVPEGYVSLPASDTAFYDAMIDGFAEAVVALIPRKDLVGGN